MTKRMRPSSTASFEKQMFGYYWLQCNVLDAYAPVVQIDCCELNIIY